MSEPARRLATYEDVLRTPPNRVAEIINGVLYAQARPAGPHSAVSSALGEELGPPFKRGRGGPGGWIILDEPELHLAADILVPDLAGWLRERLPVVPNEPFFTLRPNWVCEVLSPSTEKIDRAEKLPTYAREGVEHAWLVNPLQRMLEASRLESGRWLSLGVYRDDARARIEPFEALELDLALLWADLGPST
jgi:Uma2 family endonuclease